MIINYPDFSKRSSSKYPVNGAQAIFSIQREYVAGDSLPWTLWHVVSDERLFLLRHKGVANFTLLYILYHVFTAAQRA